MRHYGDGYLEKTVLLTTSTKGAHMNTKISRRQFLKGAAAVGVGAALPLKFGVRSAHAFYQSPGLQRWKTALRGVGPGGIPVAIPDAAIAPVTGVAHYTINIQQFTDQLHPSLGPTTLWGYYPTRLLGGGVQPPRHLGGIIVVPRRTPLQLTFRNKLPSTSIIPVDTTVPGANQAQNRAAVHLHGGFIPWISDGGPFDWWTPNGTHGLSFLNNSVLNPAAAANEAEYYYPNDQSARLLWYHDHAIGITRTNAYAGIATGYIIRDDFEEGLQNSGLPGFIEAGGREIPIVIQDKIFVGPNIGTLDPTWQGPRAVGSLWYPHVYERNRWKLIGTASRLPNPSVIAEMFGDTMLANGTVYPQVDVEPRRYRFRILNACNARFLNLQLYVENGSTDGISLDGLSNPTNAKGPDWLVLGTEGGFLPYPVVVPSNGTFNPITIKGSLVTGNAERWDVLVDFKGFEGQNIILYTDAPAPFPFGDPRNDYFPGAPGNPIQPAPGFGPNTRQILRFRVGTTISGSSDLTLAINESTDLRPGNEPFLADVHPDGTYDLRTAVTTTRQLTLNEAFDAYGRLVQLIGTNAPLSPGKFGRPYLDTATETPSAGDVEIWEIANLTGDTHPIHFHLVNVQILNRQAFDPGSYNGTPSFLSPPVAPDPTELGWKETVRMNPGEVIRVIMRFDLPAVPFSVPPSPRTGGNEYVYHCHILEHEEHDMMRPLVVAP
jgi:spore coat protein A